MNDTAEAPKPQGLGGFEETVKDFWASRPRRPARGGKIGGVAAAIGNRYGIDPVVVRVAFVTATVFGGVGLSLYVLCWLVFAAEGDEVSPVEALFGRGRSSLSKPLTIALGILFFPLSSWAFAGGWFDGGGVIGAAMMVTALYLLHRSRGHLNRPAPTVRAVTDVGPAAFSMSAPGTAEKSESGWDPLGADPMAWDLPDPQPAPAPPPPPSPPSAPRRKSKIGIATLGVALLVGGIGAAIASDGHTWFSAQHVIGLVLGVLGVGMVAGAFAGGGRKLAILAVPLSIIGVALTTLPVNDYSGGLGDLRATPLTAAEVQPTYERTAGTVDLDLTQLPADVPVATEIHVGAGDTTVLVPETADVTYSCESHAGDVQCLGRGTSGVGTGPTTGVDYGPDGVGGLQLTVKIDQGVGTVEVNRG
ncbi:phage shock protein PspC (stress-responsive transcriptional regulator) [Amycolatopsis endophytica]|uniref:Phage shock protein PspC (Stress-responsive transcriptional regulator) n=2 Tax=Amycolatopsis endophytica TaxID=860233 RepID=A0A853AYU8_9PSEU|nr:phage shock protein PspC (stress-responsive transcriptional regulator) [Amycolatopsis endophytica]